MDDLKAKANLITGASTGIGAGCARAFGALGARVAVHYNSSKEAAGQRRGGQRSRGRCPVGGG